jgi:hypothetical protein
VTVDAGAPSAAGTGGVVAVGGTNANSVEVGRAGKVSEVKGALLVDEAFRAPDGDISGVPGSGIVNKIVGRAAIAAGAAAATITNSFVTAASHVFISPEGAAPDATALRWTVSYAAGSFTVTFNANATATLKFSFFVVNP